jgi:two-component system, NtrC family, response regulator AtoC
MSDRNTSTKVTAGAAEGMSPSGTCLLVLGDEHFASYAVRPGEDAVIGRETGCAIRLKGDQVSRRHAIVHGGQPTTVEDLGSKNGVKVHGRRLPSGERHPVLPGESFQIGGYIVVVLAGPVTEVGSSDGPRAALVIPDPTREGAAPLVERIARHRLSVLIRGETGVGKEILSRTVHDLSGRRGRFIALNCAALSESLLESELFGHERGAFTGAVEAKPGLFEAAAGGTVLLDEVGDMPLGTQAKLLRVLESRQVTRLGSVRPIDLDVRFLAATHQDLDEAVRRKTFRQDLYYRLNGVTLVVPPLRERPEAIAPLAAKLLAEAATRHDPGAAPPRLSAAVLAVLVQHTWPGNVRELKAVLERALILAGGGELRPKHFVLGSARLGEERGSAGDRSPPGPGEDEERARIVAALDSCAGNQTRAARVLGISRATLVTKLRLLRIPRPRS